MIKNIEKYELKRMTWNSDEVEGLSVERVRNTNGGFIAMSFRGSVIAFETKDMYEIEAREAADMLRNAADEIIPFDKSS